MRKKQLDRSYILSRTTINERGCLEWNGATSRDGYGLLRSKGKSLKAHRVSYSIEYGEIPKGMLVCHKCDNPKCCNTDHLFLGTQKENMEDMKSKGRGNYRVHYGNNFRSVSITIENETFTSYREAAKKFNITDNGVRKRFKGRIIINHHTIGEQAH